MPANSAVEAFDIPEDFGSGLLASKEHCLVYEFDLTRREEAFGHRVVAAVAPTAHAARYRAYRQQAAVGICRILAAAVGTVVFAWCNFRRGVSAENQESELLEPKQPWE